MTCSFGLGSRHHSHVSLCRKEHLKEWTKAKKKYDLISDFFFRLKYSAEIVTVTKTNVTLCVWLAIRVLDRRGQNFWMQCSLLCSFTCKKITRKYDKDDLNNGKWTCMDGWTMSMWEFLEWLSHFICLCIHIFSGRSLGKNHYRLW